MYIIVHISNLLIKSIYTFVIRDKLIEAYNEDTFSATAYNNNMIRTTHYRAARIVVQNDSSQTVSGFWLHLA